ncbi:protein-disulfide reductase DsbD domain-containing protein [Pedobacter sp. BMA]|uniref:protein-disulfide reductase DsbD domain-containing protein n=1 Tax=Pedobacter sp. BMA TaxID=1663685 RepID=UPI00064B15BE|nr:protein-disulfide reductase DsbD domain-containing protein [Pedobacter sp. BMA]KLT67064.1 hypothetical protein AB669_03950 [Pedobacter sp. BMA]
MMKKIGMTLMFTLTVLFVKAQSPFDKKITEAIKQLSCAVASEEIPVTLNARIVTEMDSAAVIVKIQISPGWHVYQHVPTSMPYIALEHILKLPEDVKPIGTWIVSPPIPSVQDEGVLIYENEAWFVHKIQTVGEKKQDSIIRAGVYYQACDLRQCLRPSELALDLKM